MVRLLKKKKKDSIVAYNKQSLGKIKKELRRISLLIIININQVLVKLTKRELKTILWLIIIKKQNLDEMTKRN